MVNSLTYSLKSLISGDHLSFQCDVSNSASVTNLVNKIKEKYSAAPQIAVNAAGITRDKTMMKLTEEDFEKVINVNLKVCTFNYDINDSLTFWKYPSIIFFLLFSM